MFGRITRLTAYLQEEARYRHGWGSHDCVTFIANWVARETGIDPAAQIRGTYATEADGERHIGTFGGLALAVGRGMRRAGFLMTRDLSPGDPALIVVENEESCAIRTGRRFAIRMRTGFRLLPPERVRLITGWKL